MADNVTQNINELDLSFRLGDDFAFDLTSPFSLAGATIEATIGTLNFTIDTVSEFQITLSLTEAQTITLQNGTPWLFRVTKDGYTRTYFQGKFVQL